MLKKVKFKNKKGRKYKQMIYILSFVFLFFLSSRIIFNAPQKNEDTPLRKPVSFENLTAEVANKRFFTDKNLLQVGLIVKEMNSDMPSNIDVNIKEKTNQNKKFKTEIVKIVDEYYVIFIHDLPKKWKSVSIEVINKNANQGSVNLNSKLYIANEKSEVKNNFTKQNLNYYKEEYINILIQDTQKHIKSNEDLIKNNKKDIDKIKQKISSLKSNLEYETDQEKEVTNQEINEKNSKIESINKENSTKETEIKELKNRVQNLELKRKNL
ncbi:Uncharacterised protein [[Clostridium] sordellii]|uniref:hypothetical protein n=1 Tax=Paraclostridium sordellii TaxID=1505 RepID=UPI0005DBF7FE|nr:hypothetical protein [Paeniclostridium sordellii]CEN25486.1 Uncharacterised protein [[Clostridium] sordellii] [Paeniclostridium sordellii]